MLGRMRRTRLRVPEHGSVPDVGRDAPPITRALPVAGTASWDYTALPAAPLPPAPQGDPGPRARVLSLFSDPRVHTVTVEAVVRVLERPRQDVETVLDAMVQAGDLVLVPGPTRQFRMSPREKRKLEAMFREAAQELGEHGVLATRPQDELALSSFEDDTEEPRLPVTAGLLSLFLPGTGQLLNGDVGRASLVFAVWSLAWITHLSPVWTFVCLYAGAEAFFTAKIRSMERKLAKEASLPGGAAPPALPPPKPSST